MPRSQTGLELTVISGGARWMIAVAMLAVVTLSAIAFRSIGTTTVSAQINGDQNAAPEATVVISGNPASITINDNGVASLYPSTATISGVNQSITRVRVQLNNFTHTFPDDVDIILEGPQGQRAMVMSDAGGGGDVTNLQLTYDSVAPLSSILPDDALLTTGTFRAVNYGDSSSIFTDTFPAPFPAPNTLTNAPADLSVFHQTNPNGDWKLYVVDDATQDTGSISGGWTLIVTVPNIFTVNSTNDPGNGVCDGSECTLREAINAAIAATGNSDQVSFSSLFNTPQTIDLLTPLPDITESMAIAGPGANLLTVRRSFTAATDFRIFNITNAATNGVAISGMTITGGNASTGGGIISQSHLTLTNVHVTGNKAESGGGVFLGVSDGIFIGCTFSGNTADGDGGGINYQAPGRTLRLVNSTVSGNQASSGGGIKSISFSNANAGLEVVSSTIANNSSTNYGGIHIEAFDTSTVTTTLRNTIIANNSPTNLATQAGGGVETFQTLGFNLSDNYNGVFTPLGTDITNSTPRLGPLSLGGGTTPTHALLGSSPALNAGNASGSATDQRGVARPATLADIGAVEMQAIVVDNAGDGGPGSLRAAITTANSNGFALDDIVFDNNVFGTPQTISLATALPDIGTNLTMNGPGADLLTVQRADGVPNFKVFSSVLLIGGELGITGLTVRNGRGFVGGGIFSFFDLSLTNVHVTGNQSTGAGGGVYFALASGVFSNCTFSDNSAAEGGAIYFDGDQFGGKRLMVANSTISGNTATGSGGGILARTGADNGLNPGILIVRNSTIANNTAAGGGGIASETAAGNTTLTSLRNTIVANNSPNNLTAGSGVTVSSLGFNLSNNFNGVFTPLGTDTTAPPQLAPLANNGGTTPTHALNAGSQALDRGNSSGSITDQRSSIRPIDLAGITNTSDGSDIGAFEAQTAPISQRRAPFDYDGDNKTDISIFRPGPGEWWALRSSNGSNFALQFGSSVDKIVPADYTGDGKADIAFWRPSNGNWFVLRSEDLTFFAFPFGATSDMPVPSDFDGDGKADPAVFRPSTQNWFINKSTGGTDILTFGAAGDKPVVADYDGDSKADIAIFRPAGVSGSEWWVRNSSNASVFALQFGVSTDRPVQGDFTGDGKADVAFWRPANGNWFVLRSEDLSFFAFPFGANGDTPVPGDYDGDGKFDAGVFRPSSVTWFVQRSTAGTLIQAFGTAGDIPTPSAYVP